MLQHIKSYLDTAKIPYHLSADGKSIEVPTSEVANVKLGVESQGLNKNGSLGFGVFSDSSSFGITDNEFKVKYLNAIQGELQQLLIPIKPSQVPKFSFLFQKKDLSYSNSKRKQQHLLFLQIEAGLYIGSSQS